MYSYIVHINGSLLDLTCVHVFSRSCSSRPGQLGMALGKASHSARFARLRGKRVLVIRSFGVWLFSNCICGEYLQISTTARNLFSFCFGRKEPMRRGPLNQRFKAFFDFTAFYKSQLDLFAPCRKSAGAVFSKKKFWSIAFLSIVKIHKFRRWYGARFSFFRSPSAHASWIPKSQV